MTWLLALLASVALAQNPPYTLTDTKTKQDTGAINSDMRALADSIRKSNSEIRDLQESLSESTNTAARYFTGPIVFSDTVTFSAPVSGTYNVAFASSVATEDVGSAGVYGTITGSTITLTVAANKQVKLTAFIPMCTGSSGGYYLFSRPGWSNGTTSYLASKKASWEYHNGASDVTTHSFVEFTPLLAAGTYTFYLQAGSDSAVTPRINCSYYAADAFGTWHFFVEEIR